MPRKLCPSEARKIRAMLGEGFTDFEISRALHVAHSSVSDLRNGRNENQNNVKEPDEKEPTIEHEDMDSEKTDLDKDSTEYSEIKSSEQIQKESLDIEEPETINFVGGRKHLEKEKFEFEHECSNCGYEFNGRPKFCSGCGIEFEQECFEGSGINNNEGNECANCGTEIQGHPKFCTGCGMEFDWKRRY
jgi:hypothetical protein